MTMSSRQMTDVLTALSPEVAPLSGPLNPPATAPLPPSPDLAGWYSLLQQGADVPVFDWATLINPPTNPTDATNKAYVDGAIANGGTVNSAITIQSALPDAPGSQGPKLYIHATGTVSPTPWPGIEMNTEGPPNPASGAAGYISSSRQGKSRWTIEIGGSSVETGGNTGTNFAIRPFTDAGSPLPIAFQITRAGTGFWDATTLTFGQLPKNQLMISPGAAVTNPTVISTLGTGGLQFTGNLGFYTAPPVAKQTLTGAKAGNAALASVIAALAAYGLAIDTTTA